MLQPLKLKSTLVRRKRPTARGGDYTIHRFWVDYNQQLRRDRCFEWISQYKARAERQAFSAYGNGSEVIVVDIKDPDLAVAFTMAMR